MNEETAESTWNEYATIVTRYNPETSISSISNGTKGDEKPSLTIDERIFNGFKYVDIRYLVHRYETKVVVTILEDATTFDFDQNNITEYARFVWNKSLQQKISLECLIELLDHTEKSQYGNVDISFDENKLMIDEIKEKYGWDDAFISKYLPDSYRYCLEPEYRGEVYYPYQLIEEINQFWLKA